MYSYTKVKKDFAYRNVQFKGIECYEGNGNDIDVTTTGTAQMIRQILKNKYPKIDGQKTWVKTRKFANGNSIDVYLNRVPESVFNEINTYLKVFDSWMINHRGEKREQKMTDDGKKLSAYTKFLFVYNNPPYDAKEKEQPAPDWDKILSESTPTPKSGGSKTSKASWDKGTLLRECGGWKVYQKTLPDGREVVSAFKDKETAPNKTDWNLIKGEIYTESGFKWGRFGNFEKWGSVEESQLDKLCSILTKYYGGGKQEETPNDVVIPQYEIDALIDYTKKYYEDEFTMDEIKKAVDEYVQNLKNKNKDWWTWGGGDSTDRERVYSILLAKKKEKDKSGMWELYIDGAIQNENKFDSANDVFQHLRNKYSNRVYETWEVNDMVAPDWINKKVFVITSQFRCGQRFVEQLNFGNLLVLGLNSLGFISYDYQTNDFKISKINKKKDGLIVTDLKIVPKFSLRLKSNDKEIGKVDYQNKDVLEIAREIEKIYDTEFETEKKDDSTPSKEDVEKQIRALRYLAEAGDDEAQKQINALKYLLN